MTRQVREHRPRGLTAICEVKEFETTVIRDRLQTLGRHGMMSPKHVFGAVRGQVDAAARQLKPFAGADRPLVIVLANPQGADVNLDPQHVVLALYGNPAFHFAVDPERGEAVGEMTYFADRDGALTAKHAYVSAVVTVHERSLEQEYLDEAGSRFPGDAVGFLRWAREAKERGEIPEGTRRLAHVFHTESAARGDARPLPEEFFNGPDDHAWVVRDGAYAQVR